LQLISGWTLLSSSTGIQVNRLIITLDIGLPPRSPIHCHIAVRASETGTRAKIGAAVRNPCKQGINRPEFACWSGTAGLWRSNLLLPLSRARRVGVRVACNRPRHAQLWPWRMSGPDGSGDAVVDGWSRPVFLRKQHGQTVICRHFFPIWNPKKNP
jgi:hypothetical protein